VRRQPPEGSCGVELIQRTACRNVVIIVIVVNSLGGKELSVTPFTCEDDIGAGRTWCRRAALSEYGKHLDIVNIGGCCRGRVGRRRPTELFRLPKMGGKRHISRRRDELRTAIAGLKGVLHVGQNETKWDVFAVFQHPYTRVRPRRKDWRARL
jgi:hypothetical protein